MKNAQASKNATRLKVLHAAKKAFVSVKKRLIIGTNSQPIVVS